MDLTKKELTDVIRMTEAEINLYHDGRGNVHKEFEEIVEGLLVLKEKVEVEFNRSVGLMVGK